MNQFEKNFENYLPLNRKEKFYTGTVLPQIICHENFKYFNLFTNLIRNFPLGIEIKTDLWDNNIQFFTEYSLKESVVSGLAKTFVELPKTKETPDLIIVITKPELILIVVEAKVYNPTDADSLSKQMQNQVKIISSIKKTINIRDENVFHIGIVPKKLINKRLIKEFQLLYWEDILESYSIILKDNYFFNLLVLAMKKFDDLFLSSSGQHTSYGKNMDSNMSGLEIVKMFSTTKKFWVGRHGGLTGDALLNDKNSGIWKTKKYEVNISSSVAPNRNWFSAEEFIRFMEVEPKVELVKNQLTGSFPSGVSKNFNMPLHEWHFSHLGKDYFLQVSALCGYGITLDVPIEIIYIGKKGVPYAEKKRGRNVNPNWAVVKKDGRELKCQSSNNFVEAGLWKKSNCHVFYWEEIKMFFKDQTKMARE